MRKLATLTIAMTILSFISSTGALAQRGNVGRGRGGWGSGTPYAIMYNLQTVETIRGEVVSVKKFSPRTKGIDQEQHPVGRGKNDDEKSCAGCHGPGGEVVSVGEATPRKAMYDGVHALLKTGKDTITVHLGPVWYIENQDLKIAPKDRIEVRGSRITFVGRPALIAAEVKRGDEVLTLRDANGFPAWRGWKRR